MWNRQLLSTFYKSTVIPVTYCTVALSVYSLGYSDMVESIIYHHKPNMITYTFNIIESSAFGCCIGIIYPVGIPATIGYLYTTRHKD